MGSKRTRLAARFALKVMEDHGYKFNTIINVGVGSCPEARIWEQLHQERGVKIIGVDARGRHNRWPYEYIHAAVGDGTKDFLEYCCGCRSCNCLEGEAHANRIARVKSITIDDISANYPAPYFLWMDIEGGEREALLGAKKTLENTKFLCLEVSELWRNGDTKPLVNLLDKLGYVSCGKVDYPDIEDELFVRKQS